SQLLQAEPQGLQVIGEPRRRWLRVLLRRGHLPPNMVAATGVVGHAGGYPFISRQPSRLTAPTYRVQEGPTMPGSGTLPPGLVVLGGSAGGVEALSELVGGLAPAFPAAVLVVIHVPPTGTSALPIILNRRGALPARHAQDGDELRAGEVLVAPPDHHLVVLDG